jgi:hypothetical protein
MPGWAGNTQAYFVWSDSKIENPTLRIVYSQSGVPNSEPLNILGNVRQGWKCSSLFCFEWFKDLELYLRIVYSKSGVLNSRLLSLLRIVSYARYALVYFVLSDLKIWNPTLRIAIYSQIGIPNSRLLFFLGNVSLARNGLAYFVLNDSKIWLVGGTSSCPDFNLEKSLASIVFRAQSCKTFLRP